MSCEVRKQNAAVDCGVLNKSEDDKGPSARPLARLFSTGIDGHFWWYQAQQRKFGLIGGKRRG